MLGTPETRSRTNVGIAILLLILALIFGGIGLLVEGLMWLLIIAVVLAVAGAVTGGRGRRA
jgi:CHASE2 domain-containing sensor protein